MEEKLNPLSFKIDSIITMKDSQRLVVGLMSKIRERHCEKLKRALFLFSWKCQALRIKTHVKIIFTSNLYRNRLRCI